MYKVGKNQAGPEIGLNLRIKMPEVPSSQPDACPPIEDRVRKAMEMVEYGSGSRRDWEFLRRVNNCLVKKYKARKCNDRMLNILKMIQPTMEKYGQYDHEGVESCPELHSSATGAKGIEEE